MKPVYVIILVIIVAAFALGDYHGVALAASQSEGAIPQSGDLCGGTGGNGQIVSVGNSSFTIKRNDGSSLIVNLTQQATIQTSTGPASLSDLKTGDRVTLVGGPNPDGSFTANTVMVCAGVGQGTQSGQNKAINFNKAKAWSLYLNISAMLLVSLIWIGIAAFLLFKKKKSLVYLLFFTVFYVYIVTVLYYTLYIHQSLLLLKYFVPDLMLNGTAAGKSLNLIPLITITLGDLKFLFLNILLFMPFGFGLPFVTNFRFKKIVVIGALFSIAIELLHLLTGLLAKMTFRVVDINDVIFNTVGVAIGYILFVAFVRIYRHLFRNWKISANPILRYIAERPQVNT